LHGLYFNRQLIGTMMATHAIRLTIGKRLHFQSSLWCKKNLIAQST